MANATTNLSFSAIVTAATITLTLVATIKNLEASDTVLTKLNLTGNTVSNTLTGMHANILNGGLGADTLRGGWGNDGLTGGIGADVFQWSLAGKGVIGIPSVDRVLDFNNSEDVLNLRDLLQGETVDNIANYLDIVTSTSSGVTSTEIRISSNGEFTNGNCS